MNASGAIVDVHAHYFPADLADFARDLTCEGRAPRGGILGHILHGSARILHGSASVAGAIAELGELIRLRFRL